MAVNSLTSTNLKKFKCSSCQNYLSFYPIYLTSEINTCGRCPFPEGALRNVAYESIAAAQKFPCRYQNNGCLKELLPKNVQDHEKICQGRDIACHVAGCDWKGTFYTVAEHYKACHENFSKISHKFEIDVRTIQKDHLLAIMFIEDKVFAVKFNCNIFYPEVIQGSFSFEGIDNEIEEYLCKEVFQIGKYEWNREFFLSLPHEKQTFSLNIPNKTSKDEFETTLIRGELTFNKRYGYDKGSNAYNLSKLKCGTCQQYATPPIPYSRTERICSSCYKTQFPDTPMNIDHQMTEFAWTVYYPCDFHLSGCTFFATLLEIKNHAITCKYSKMECCFTKQICPWMGLRKDLARHALTAHTIPEIVTVQPSREGIHAIIKFEDNIFWFRTITDELTHFCTVQLISCSSENFKYQLEIIHSNTSKLIIQKNCAAYNQFKVDSHNTGCNYYLPKEYVSCILGDEGELFFKVKIFKISRTNFINV